MGEQGEHGPVAYAAACAPGLEEALVDLDVFVVQDEGKVAARVAREIVVPRQIGVQHDFLDALRMRGFGGEA